MCLEYSIKRPEKLVVAEIGRCREERGWWSQKPTQDGFSEGCCRAENTQPQCCSSAYASPNDDFKSLVKSKIRASFVCQIKK